MLDCVLFCISIALCPLLLSDESHSLSGSLSLLLHSFQWASSLRKMVRISLSMFLLLVFCPPALIIFKWFLPSPTPSFFFLLAFLLFASFYVRGRRHSDAYSELSKTILQFAEADTICVHIQWQSNGEYRRWRQGGYVIVISEVLKKWATMRALLSRSIHICSLHTVTPRSRYL